MPGVDDPHARSAAALYYDAPSMAAPKVVAKGYGTLAERIIAEAERNGVYVHHSPDLVGLLMGLDLDAEIPAGLYRVVAELLAWIQRMDSSAS